MPKINQTELNAIAVPTPPLAEQRRIVAKVDQLMALVDQLMALVDQLEAQLERSQSAAQKLLEALVAELTQKNQSISPCRESMLVARNKKGDERTP